MFKQCCLIVFLILILIKPVRSESYLKVVTNCNDVVILLDTTHIRQAALLKVNSGNYILKCWAPNHEMTIPVIQLCILKKNCSTLINTRFIKRSWVYTKVIYLALLPT